MQRFFKKCHPLPCHLVMHQELLSTFITSLQRSTVQDIMAEQQGKHHPTNVTWWQIFKTSVKYPYFQACERFGKKNVPFMAAALLTTTSFVAYKYHQEKNSSPGEANESPQQTSAGK